MAVSTEAQKVAAKLPSSRLLRQPFTRIAIAPTLRGRGLAVSFVTAISEYAFHTPATKILTLNVYSHNHAAISSYRRAGFTLEAILPNTVMIDGTLWSTHVMIRARPTSQNLVPPHHRQTSPPA